MTARTLTVVWSADGPVMDSRIRAVCLLATLLALAPGGAAAQPFAPALDPPALAGEESGPLPELRMPGGGGASLPEWTLHKTADGAHPNGIEQALVWYMNRARRDPDAEGEFLASVDEPEVQSAVAYFDVDLDLLRDEFAALPAKPPAAFDRRLYQAAAEHSLYLISIDGQNHDAQFDRISAAGFHVTSARGNVFSYAESALYGHAGFNIDWGGSDGTGMQSGRGHRKAIMSSDGDYTNVGIAAVPETSAATSVGPLVVTGNYAKADTGYAAHYNRFLVGTVWDDLDGDALYDPGEGVPGVTVTPSPGAFFAVTGAGGGYALPVLASGTVQVAFAGGGVPSHAVSVSVGSTSKLVDYPLAELVPEPGAFALQGTAALALAALGRRRGRQR